MYQIEKATAKELAKRIDTAVSELSDAALALVRISCNVTATRNWTEVSRLSQNIMKSIRLLEEGE